MKELIFKTNIKNLKEVNNLKDRLNIALGFREWRFNTEDNAIIFRVEVLSTTPTEIITLFKSFDIYCEEVNK